MEEVCGWFGCDISIHAPREGGDYGDVEDEEFDWEFQSTPPARGATSSGKAIGASTIISIHAPREGGDQRYDQVLTATKNISIHAPREGGDVLNSKCNL